MLQKRLKDLRKRIGDSVYVKNNTRWRKETIHHLSEVLGTTVFMYKGLEYTVPNDILNIYDIECPGCDDILYLHYLNHNLDGIVTIIHKDFLSMTDDELQKLKEGQQGL